jgi:hypothetical protein
VAAPDPRIPTAEEISVFGSLDEGHACAHFLGKNVSEAQALFADKAITSLTYLEDLMWMGPVAFRYYVAAAIAHLQSESSKGDFDFLNGFAGTLEFRAEHYANELRPVAKSLNSACRFALQRLESAKLDALDGDLPSRYEALCRRFAVLADAENGPRQ